VHFAGDDRVEPAADDFPDAWGELVRLWGYWGYGRGREKRREE
jgi:hypothetical protein